jgi:hypothetical protein
MLSFSATLSFAVTDGIYYSDVLSSYIIVTQNNDLARVYMLEDPSLGGVAGRLEGASVDGVLTLVNRSASTIRSSYKLKQSGENLVMTRGFCVAFYAGDGLACPASDTVELTLVPVALQTGATRGVYLTQWGAEYILIHGDAGIYVVSVENHVEGAFNYWEVYTTALNASGKGLLAPILQKDIAMPERVVDSISITLTENGAAEMTIEATCGAASADNCEAVAESFYKKAIRLF